MSEKKIPYKIYLEESEMPKTWYNVRADMKNKPAPLLNPETFKPMTEEELSVVFCEELVKQELDNENRYIEIPEKIRDFYKMYRPAPLIRAYCLEEKLQTPAKIYYKFEGNNTSGSHKLNSAIAQAYYAKEQGLTSVTTETGAGQWGTALSEACSYFGLPLTVYFDLDCKVYMVKVSYEQKPFRREVMRTYGASVTPSPSETTEVGRKILAEHPGTSGSLGCAISEAVEVATHTPGYRYVLGSVLNQVLLHQSVIGVESKIAMDKYGIHVDPDALVSTLPVAKQQMVEILKILVRDPELIILDEPTSALAKKEVVQLYQIIHNLLDNGKTIIFISHRLEELFELGDRITVFKDGHYVGTRDMKEMNEDELIKMMVGRSLTNIFPPPVCEPDYSKVVFEAKNLTDNDGKLKDVSFQVFKGEVLGIAGLQGHGQTELLNAISGLYPLTKGEIIVNGKTEKIKSASQAIQCGVALVPADRKRQGLMLELSNRHNLAVSSMKKRMNGPFIDQKAETSFAEDMVKRLSIKLGGLELPVSSLSGGNQQKIVLGKELATEPKVILFDEPTRGIDVEAKREFYQIMHELAAQGVAVIMNSSDMMEVIGMSSRVIVMYEGRISGTLQKEELSEELIMQFGMGMKKERTKEETEG